MTAQEALAILEKGASTDQGVRSALILLRGRHPLAAAINAILDGDPAPDTPVPDTKPEAKGTCT